MSFWGHANAQAGRDTGSRFWWVFLIINIISKIWPGLLLLALGGMAFVGYRMAAPHWDSSAWPSQTTLATLGTLLVAVLIGWAVLTVVRAFTGPPRSRRSRGRRP